MKTNVWKRGLSLLLAMVLVLGFLPMNLTASAEEATGNLGQADGIIWLEKVVDSNGNTDASSAFYGKIFSLDDMIREALGITDNSVVVRYEGVNLGDPMELITNQGKAEQLKDRLKAAISNHELMAVTVGGEEKLIAFRNVASAQISVGEDNIIYVDHAGAPDDIETVVKNALDSMQVTVELSGTVTAPAKDHKADVEVGKVMDSNGEVDYDFLTWPVGGKMEIGTVELSVYADEYDDGHEFTDSQKSTTTATVVLRDSLCTLEYKGVILDENGYVVKEISLGKFTQYIGEEPQIPEDDYYQIVGWQTAPPAKVEGSSVYTAILSAEKYTVTFLVDGAVYDTVTDYRGTELLVSDPTSGNPSLRFNVWKPDVNGDGELDAEELKGNYVPEIEGNITYIATWTEGPSVVLYLKERGKTVPFAYKPEVYSNGSAWTAETPAVEDLLLTEEDKANGYQIVWYYEGGSEDVNCDDIYSETQFVSDVTALPDTDAVALYMEKIRLLDGEEYAVGTVKNPAYVFNYLTSGGNLYYSVELTQSEYLQNPKPVEPEYNGVPADKVFTGWEYSAPVPNADASVYTITVTLKPFEELKNTIELGTPDAFIYEEFYTCSVEPEGNRLVVVFKDKVTGVEYKGYVQIADMGRTYDAATKIMVTPLWKYENGVKTNEMGFYVNNLLIGKDQNAREVARWNNYNAYKDASDVALMAINSADSKLYIDYQFVELGQNLAKMNAGQEYSEEDIFGNLVSGMLPYNNGEDVTVQYWSEGEENVTVDLYKLYELLDANGVGILKSMIEEQVGTSATYDLPGQWININNLPDAELTAQEAVDTLCGKSYQNLEDARFSNEALGQFAADVFAMEQTVKETAIHKFGYNDLKGALANAVNEKLRITYQNEKVYATRDYKITLTDNRATVSFAAISDITTPYNSGVEDKILDKVILTNSNGETVAWGKDDVVTMIDGVARDFSVAGSGTYKDVQVFFKGNAQYMPAFSEKFDVTVTKINPGVDVVDLIAEIHGDKYFDKAGVTVIPDAPVVQIIAGVAVDELKFDKDLTIKDDKIVVDAWVKLPETYTNLLDNFELENLNGVLDGVTLPDKTIHIGAYYEIEHLEDELQAYVDKGGAGAGLMEELLNIVDQIPERVVNRLGLNDLSYTLRVRIDPLENEVYPTEPGFYVNFAATVSRVMQIAAKAQGKEYVDPNYGVAEDVGFIVLSPMIPIPNRGGIQLYDGEVSNAQNKFEYEYNGTPVVRDLEVALNGVKLEDAEPFYYGISTRFKQVKEAPSKPGVYFAGYNYTKEVLNEDTGEMEVRRLGSDSAIIIIKQQEADLNIVGGTYEYDEQDHIADVIVTDKNGNEIHDAAVTVISGTVNVEGGTNVTTNDLYGTVNIDFPEGLTVPVAPNELPMRIEDAWNYYREKILEKQDAEKIVPSDVIAFLTWCGDKASEEAKNAFAEFEKMATDETVKAALDKINGVQSYVDVSSGTLIQKAERLQDMMMGLKGRYDYLIKQLKPLEKLDDNISITFYDLEKDADKLDYHRTGAYLYVGAITDPDYTIGAGKALVIIHSDDEYLMHDTHVPYDGKEHDIFIEDTTGRGDVQFIVYGENDGVIAIDKITKEVHLQIEDELSDLVCEFLNASGIFDQTITGESDVYLGTVYTKTENKVDQWTEKLTDKIIAKVKEKAKAKLVGDYAWADSAIDKVEEKVTAYLDTKYEDLKDTLLAKLNEIEQLDEGTRLYVNGFIPADLGTYEVTYFDFNVNEINMLLDNDVIQAVKAACEELGYHIELKDGSDTYVITAYEKADDAIVKFAQANVDDIIDDIFDYVVDNLEKYIDTKQDEYDTSEKVEAALEALKARIPAWKTKLLNSIQKVDGLDNYTRIVINGKKPVDVGTYNFFGFDFDMAATRGKLVIEPIYIEVEDKNANKVVGQSDPELEVTVSYYSYEGLAPNVKQVKITELPAGVTEADLVKYSVTRTPGEEIGKYDISVEATLLNDSGNYKLAPREEDKQDFEILPEVGTIGLGEWRMNLDSVVYLHYYPTLTGFSEGFDFSNPDRAGVVIWTGKQAPTSRHEVVVTNTEKTTVIKGWKYNDTEEKWYIRSHEIYAKNLGDMVYIRPYVIDHNGEYVYLDGVPYYSPEWLSYDVMNNTGRDEAEKYVCAALLQYGASAQIYFNYKTDDLVTTIPKDHPNVAWEDYDLNYYESYRDDILINDHVITLAETLKKGENNKIGVSYTNKAALDLAGAIRFAAGFDIDTSIIDVDKIAKAEVLFWNERDIIRVDSLEYKYENYSYKCGLEKETNSGDLRLGDYRAKTDHILAKYLGESIYFTCRIVMEDGTVYNSGLGYYSPEVFAGDHIDKSSGQIVEVCKRIIVYSEMAEKCFIRNK